MLETHAPKEAFIFVFDHCLCAQHFSLIELYRENKNAERNEE